MCQGRGGVAHVGCKAVYHVKRRHDPARLDPVYDRRSRLGDKAKNMPRS